MHSLQLQKLLLIYCPGHAGIRVNEREIDGQAKQTWYLVLELGRVLRNYLNTDRSQHQFYEGKRSGERKRPTSSCLRPGPISVQPDKHWYCIKGSLGEKAERWGRACMGLSSAAMPSSWIWKLETFRIQLFSICKPLLHGTTGMKQNLL